MCEERKERCETCRFVDDDGYNEGDFEAGACRKNPPYTFGMANCNECGPDVSLWPIVLKREWCGEWQPMAGHSAAQKSDRDDFLLFCRRLSCKTVNALECKYSRDNKPVRKMSQLLSMTAKELLEYKGIGRTALNEIRDELTVDGKRLAGD